MGREVRRVPKDWNPPKSESYKDGLQPHFDQDFKSASEEWKAGYEKWKTEPEQENCEYWEWTTPPDRDYYRPAWTDEERTHLMLYSTTSEGTPMSPAFATPEELARYLADNKVSSFGDSTATYEQWLKLCQVGCAPSMVFNTNTGLSSGVEAI